MSASFGQLPQPALEQLFRDQIEFKPLLSVDKSSQARLKQPGVKTMYQQSNLHRMPNLNKLLAKCYTEGCSDSVWRDRWSELTAEKFEEAPELSMMEAYLWNASNLAYKVDQKKLPDNVYTQKEFWTDEDYAITLELIFAYGLENLLRQKFEKRHLGNIYDSFVSHAVDNGHLGIIKYLEPVRVFGRNAVNLESVAKNGHLATLQHFYNNSQTKKMFIYSDYYDGKWKEKYGISLYTILALRYSEDSVDNRPDELVFRRPIEPVIEWLLDNQLVKMNPKILADLNQDYPRVAYWYVYRYLLSKNQISSYQILSSEQLSPTQMKVRLEITILNGDKYLLDCIYHSDSQTFESM